MLSAAPGKILRMLYLRCGKAKHPPCKKPNPSNPVSHCRGVAQPGRAPGSGHSGNPLIRRRFSSRNLDKNPLRLVPIFSPKFFIPGFPAVRSRLLALQAGTAARPDGRMTTDQPFPDQLPDCRGIREQSGDDRLIVHQVIPSAYGCYLCSMFCDHLFRLDLSLGWVISSRDRSSSSSR